MLLWGIGPVDAETLNSVYMYIDVRRNGIHGMASHCYNTKRVTVTEKKNIIRLLIH